MEWMDWMRKHIGEVEQTGAPATAFDKEVFSHTDYGPLSVMDAGCAATACAALEETGYLSPHNASAISFKDYGTACELKPGCIVVFQWASGNHHVTFCDDIIDANYVKCLGGNQSSHLQDSVYPRKYIIATRWPIVKTLPVRGVLPPLSWEHTTESHPERAPWSEVLRNQVEKYFDLFSEAKDINWFIPDFSSLDHAHQVKRICDLFCGLAYYESAFNPNSSSVDVGQADDRDTWSIGLFQMSVCDQESYGLHLGFKYDDLLGATNNIILATEVMAHQMKQYGFFRLEHNVYWATLHTGGKYDKSASIKGWISKYA